MKKRMTSTMACHPFCLFYNNTFIIKSNELSSERRQRGFTLINESLNESLIVRKEKPVLIYFYRYWAGDNWRSGILTNPDKSQSPIVIM